MNAILIYGSYYGTTQRYAEELSRRTGHPAVSFQELPDLSGYDAVVHLGGLYAERVMGLSRTVKKLPETAKLMVVTVGLGDPADPRTAERLRANLQKKLPPEVYHRTEVYHLRGAMDIHKLTTRHRLMIKAFYAMLSRTAAGKESGMLESRDRPVDYVDFSALDPLVERLM